MVMCSKTNVVRTSVGAEITDHVNFIPFMRYVLLASVIFLLTFGLYDGTSFFGYVTCALLVRTGVRVRVIDKVSLISF